MKKTVLAIFAVLLFWPPLARAAVLKNTYPRLANYFLKWEISPAEAKELAKWDLLILDMETQENSPDQIREIRALNPQVIILAYLTSQEILDDVDNYNQAYLRQELNRGIYDGWWLRDASGHKVSNWPYTSMLNLTDGARPDASGQRFYDYLPRFVTTKLQASGLWDGVFYDNTWGDVSWINSGSLDLNNDGVADSRAAADELWAGGFKKMLANTRALSGGDFIIVGNGRVYDGYQSLLNGMMLESFPSFWENGGTWTGSMQTYLKLPKLNLVPPISVINIYDKNQANYRRVRYGLASTLLGDGFYSYDYDVTNHGQTWWYDEYGVKLGPAQSGPYNLLANSSPALRPGLWRRDFKNGLALVNSTDQKQTYVFNKEELEKLRGSQDPGTNSGQKINYISLAPQDGIILLKRSTLIKNAPFTNGYFFRVYDASGASVQNGFFSYASAFPGEAEVIIASGSQDGEVDINLSAASGQVSLYKNGQRIAAFYPYDKLYRKQLSLAAKLDDGYFNKVVTGAGPGGGPQVRVFSPGGKLEGSFFAYDQRLRGGVNVALGDVDGDGDLEIVTGPGAGTEARVKVFTLGGRLKNSFLAYDPNFRGGVNVAVGDLIGDGREEIVTAPMGGGGPQIRIFDSQGRALKSFFAYDQKYHGGIKVSVSDVNGDDRSEILAGLKNFY
ncbi:MAG: putative glycoside hydrolase [Patescibacteria group bacterium]